MNKVCDLVQRWLNECNVHENCTPLDDTPMPTRVLTLVGDNTQPSIRLIESKGRQGRYLALSHCWGKAGKFPLRTTSENYQEHKSGILFKNLPKTFQDTVEFAQGIGIRYLWVDSLCIIQGENGDWEKELLDMGDMYGQSIVTIAASSASSSNAGFLCRKNGAYWPVRHHQPFGSRPTEEYDDVFTLEAYIPKWGDLDRSLPLSNRGWVLQERMLASRTLSWTDHGIFWLCGKEDHSEYEDPCSVYVIIATH